MPKTLEKKRLSRETFWSFFLLDTNYFLDRKFKDEHNQGIFFLFFLIFKKRQGRSSSYTLVAHLWVWIPKYPWKCLSKLFWLCQGSDYTWSSYKFEKLLKIPQVSNVPGLWIWHGYICKGYRDFWICLNMTQYASMSEYASVCLNVPQNAWKWLNIAEYLWICLRMFE